MQNNNTVTISAVLSNYVPNTVPDHLRLLAHFISLKTLWNEWNCAYFTSRKAEKLMMRQVCKDTSHSSHFPMYRMGTVLESNEVTDRTCFEEYKDWHKCTTYCCHFNWSFMRLKYPDLIWRAGVAQTLCHLLSALHLLGHINFTTTPRGRCRDCPRFTLAFSAGSTESLRALLPWTRLLGGQARLQTQAATSYPLLCLSPQFMWLGVPGAKQVPMFHLLGKKKEKKIYKDKLEH